MKTLLETSNLQIKHRRVLFEGLNMSLSRERVALVGRNGIGKSSLLGVLAGEKSPDQGTVFFSTKPYFVRQHFCVESGSQDVKQTCAMLEQIPQTRCLENELVQAGFSKPESILSRARFSHGELQKLQMLIAKLTCPEILLLDEPTRNLDEQGVRWLKSWLPQWENALIVASHDSRLLATFENFFLVAETGCRCFKGSFAKLQEELEQEYITTQKRYLRSVNRLAKKEEHILHIARRRGRKKRYGRVSELGRATPRQRLNQKRDYAQVKHGKMKKTRDERLSHVRQWTESTRTSLHVDLPLVAPDIQLTQLDKSVAIDFQNVGMKFQEHILFENISFQLQRQRIAVVGANGVGKTTLLQIILGNRKPTTGLAKINQERIGSIDQEGANWISEETLLSKLMNYVSLDSPKMLTEILVAHKFPLALAERPIANLSPGERVRAALVCLFQRLPDMDVLVLDEPTCHLDLFGQQALTKVIQKWPGGLVIASHDKTFLHEVGIDQYIGIGKAC